MKLDIKNTQLKFEIENKLIFQYLHMTSDFSFIDGNHYEPSPVGAYGRLKHYKKFFNFNNGCQLYFSHEDDNFKWALVQKGQETIESLGYVSLYSTVQNCNSHVAHRTMLERFISSNKNILFRKDKSYYEVDKNSISFCEKFIPKSIAFNTNLFVLLKKHYYVSFSGKIIGCICVYSDKKDYFELPFVLQMFSNIEDERYKLQFVYFSSMHFKIYSKNKLLFSNSYLTVFLCDDFLLAEKINIIINDSCDDDFKQNFAAVSYKYVSDEDIENLSKDFINKEIIYIPSGSKLSYENFLKYSDYFRESSFFKIYIDTVIVDNGSCQSRSVDDMNFFDVYLNNNLSFDNELDSIFIKKIYRNAISLDDFMPWARNVGIIENKYTNYDLVLNAAAFMAGYNPVSFEHGQSYYWDKFFEPQNTTLVYGDSSSGKTFFILTITYLLSLGKGSFGLHAKKKFKVLYIDGETPEHYFKDMLLSLSFELNHDELIYSENFYPRSFKSSKDKIVWDFDDSDFVDKIIDIIIKNEINIVVIDNLNCLARQSVVSISKWNAFKAWIDETQKKYSISFVLAHHTNRTGDIAGLKNIQSASNNVIRIYGRDNLLKNIEVENQESKDNIVKYTKKGGCIFGVYIEKCHAYTDLVGNESIYRRSNKIGSFECKWEKLFPKRINNLDPLQERIDNNFLPLEDRIFYYAKKHSEFKAKDLEVYFRVSRSKISKTISNIQKSGIHKIGSGPSTRYVFRSDDSD